jgi:alpha-methylacyl-CoA racemase
LFDGAAPFYGTYECSDGRYVAIGAIEPEFWHDFLKIAGIDSSFMRDNQRKQEHWPEITQRLVALFATRPRDEWTTLFEGTAACVSPVMTFSEAVHDPQLVARKALIGDSKIAQPAPAPRFSRTPGELSAPPAYVGEHTSEILAEYGFDDARIAGLIRAEVVSQGSEDDVALDGGPLSGA